MNNFNQVCPSGNTLIDGYIPGDDDNDYKYCEDCGKRILNDIDDNSYCSECTKKREEE